MNRSGATLSSEKTESVSNKSLRSLRMLLLILKLPKVGFKAKKRRAALQQPIQIRQHPILRAPQPLNLQVVPKCLPNMSLWRPSIVLPKRMPRLQRKEPSKPRRMSSNAMTNLKSCTTMSTACRTTSARWRMSGPSSPLSFRNYRHNCKRNRKPRWILNWTYRRLREIERNSSFRVTNSKLSRKDLKMSFSSTPLIQKSRCSSSIS